MELGLEINFSLTCMLVDYILKRRIQIALNIINSNEPMAITLHITSSLISSKKMTDATMEGFEKFN